MAARKLQERKWKITLVTGGIFSIAPLIGQAMMLFTPPGSVAFVFTSCLFILGLPGTVFASVLLSNPHGASLTEVLVVGTPFNFALYSMLSYGIVGAIVEIKAKEN